MKKNYDDELQRCLDEDLNDNELKELFAHMAKDEVLRKDFRSLLALKREMQSLPVPAVRSHSPAASRVFSQNRVSIPRTEGIGIFDMISSHISVRIPVLAVILVAVGIAGYYAAVNALQTQMKTEYVYVVEMPPVVINSNYIQ